MSDAPFVRSVLHPSDFSEAGHAAFVHALAIVLYRQARFDMLHVVTGDDQVDDWNESPRVRETLERWGVLEKGSPRSALRKKLSLDVAKINIRRKDPVKAILGDVREHPVDLIVLATEGRDGMPRWLKRSVAESVVRQAKTMTLFVPKGVRGFVSADDGAISLKRILIPVDREPSPADAVAYAVRAAVMSHESPVEIVLLHVGKKGAVSWPALPELRSCTFERVERDGDAVEQISKLAEEISADLIVMATEERKGILGTLKGSVTEKVLRRSTCPVLAVPTRS
jgi:nucleotide-binding universal stress UspA family protein